MSSVCQPFLFATQDHWTQVRDGNATARGLFDRHYSRYHYKDGRKPALFVGPGEKIVLITPCARAMLVWRKFISMDKQQGVNCSVFRNEGAGLSSDLLQSAMKIAWKRWPSERLYTYVDPSKVLSTNPGYCFKRAGWTICGVTKIRRLLILQVFPA